MPDLSKFKKKTTKKAAKKIYPVFDGDDPSGEIQESVTDLKRLDKEVKERNVEIAECKECIRDGVLGFAVENLHGANKSVVVKGKGDDEILFTVSDSYRSSVDLDEIPEKYHDRFEKSFEVKVDGKKLGDDEEKVQAFLDALLELAEEHGVSDSISAKEVNKPKSTEVLVEGLSRSEVMTLDENYVTLPTTIKQR